jgi:hypothetical protein
MSKVLSTRQTESSRLVRQRVPDSSDRELSDSLDRELLDLSGRELLDSSDRKPPDSSDGDLQTQSDRKPEQLQLFGNLVFNPRAEEGSAPVYPLCADRHPPWYAVWGAPSVWGVVPVCRVGPALWLPAVPERPERELRRLEGDGDRVQQPGCPVDLEAGTAVRLVLKGSVWLPNLY